MLKKLNNLQIKDRLTRAFIMVACLLTAVSAVILITMIVMSRIYASTMVDYGFAQGDIGRAMAQFADCRSALRGIIGYDDATAINELVASHENYKNDFVREFNNLESSMITAENKAIYEKIKDYVLEHMGLKVSSLYRTSKGVVWYN